MKFKLSHKDAMPPTRGNLEAVGFDIALVELVKSTESGERHYRTGVSIELPHGYYAELYPRSSLAKTGYILMNSVGIIDPDYRGEIRVILGKIFDGPELVLPGRYVQLVIKKLEPVGSWEQVDELGETIRGDGGFGSTGVDVNINGLKV